MEFGRRLKSLGLLYGFHLLAPFPGTEVRERSASLGLRILTDDWSQYHANRAVVETAAVSRHMLDEVAIEWETGFNRYLGEIRERMPHGQATAEEVFQLTNLERIVAVYDLMMQRVIETRGHWRANGRPDGPEGSLERLLSRVQTDRFAERPEVRAAIEQAVADILAIFIQYLQPGGAAR